MIHKFLKRDLTFLLFNLKSRFRGSFLGLLWVIVFPCLTYFAHSFMIRNIQRVPYLNIVEMTYLLMGSLSWYFLTICLEMNITSITARGSIFKSFKIEKDLFIRITILENIFTTLIAFFVIAAILKLNGGNVFDYLNLSQFIFSTFLFVILIFNFTKILSLLNLFFRDTKFLIMFIVQISFFTIPILYSQHSSQHFVFKIQYINPLYYFVSAIQASVQNRSDMSLLMINIICSCLTVVMIGLNKLLYKLKQKEIYFYV